MCAGLLEVLSVMKKEVEVLAHPDLRRIGVQKVAASHCTGLPAACRLAHEFGDSFVFNNAGTELSL